MATTITAGNATNGAAISSDNTGILELKSGTGSGTTAVTVSTGQNVTFAQAANLPNTFGFKNRIINGAMVIDQRNAGASVSFSNTGGYTLDRWLVDNTTDGTISVQQSSVAPTGFTNSCLITVTAADASLSATQRCRIRQQIEGFNVADFGFGTASASTVTLSFWVRSSLTGTFGGALNNSAVDRSYPFSYTINSANTWEYKTVTIAGDTSGTWLTNNGIGLIAQFGLGIGSTFSGTAGSWVGSQIMSTTGATSLIGTNGATFYITGVQLEKGSTATSFDYRPYGTELQLAQRYFTSLLNPPLRGVVANPATSFNRMGTILPVPMRASPTITMSGTFHLYDGVAVGTATAIGVAYTPSPITVEVDLTVATGTFTASRPGVTYFNSNTANILATAEL